MTDTGTQRDAIQLLTTDHAEVEEMFRQLESGAGGDSREELVAGVVRKLSVHAAIEEQVLYPATRTALPDGETLVRQAVDEHQKVKEALAAIEGAETPAEGDRLVTQLIGDVRRHVEEEETELFPKLRASISTAELQAMAPKLVAARKLAPTHPHPNAPNTPPGNIVGGVATGLLDKARDALGRD